NVLPYTFMNNIEVNGSNTNLPLLSKVNSTTYMISFVKINNITVTNNTNLILDNVIANTLVVKDSKVIISSSTVNQIITENSTINIIESKIGGKEIAIIANNSKINITSSIIQDSTYAFSQANSVIMLNGVNMQNVTSISTIPKPTLEYSPTNITIGKELIMVNISGEYLKLLGISVNGQPISYHIISSSPTSILVSIPFNASLLADGNYLFTVTVSDGLPYNLTFNVINSYHLVSLQKSITSLRSLILPAIILAIISIIISIIAILFILMRRGGGK
ncbi:MAG: peptidase S53, partial [Saccharolobus sp.]